MQCHVRLRSSPSPPRSQYSYEPFGTTTGTGAPNGNVFQFTGRENDATGLYYYRARYYHPGRSRFVSEDPILCASGDLNFYAYVRNNPVRFSDPNGLAPGLVLPPPRPGRVIPACFVVCSVERLQREIYCGCTS